MHIFSILVEQSISTSHTSAHMVFNATLNNISVISRRNSILRNIQIIIATPAKQKASNLDIHFYCMKIRNECHLFVFEHLYL